jgi:hypothetical protein
MDYVKNRSIEFAKWLVISGMWRSDLTFEEMYEIFMEKVMINEMETEYIMEQEGKEAINAQWDM